MENICPVCGYPEMEYPATFGEICPSCGTMFGVSDDVMSYADLRRRWVEKGAPWWDKYIPKPTSWSPINQFRNISYALDKNDLIALLESRTLPITVNRGLVPTGSPLISRSTLVLARNIVQRRKRSTPSVQWRATATSGA